MARATLKPSYTRTHGRPRDGAKRMRRMYHNSVWARVTYGKPLRTRFPGLQMHNRLKQK